MPDFHEIITSLFKTVDLEDDRPMGMEGSFYTSQELFELEKSTVLLTGWHCVGRADEVANSGDYFTAQLFDDPLIVVRGDDGHIRVLANVCRHRGMMLVEGKGNAKRFVCPYHAWSYSRDGQLVRAARMDNKGFEISDCRLPEYPSEIWQGFIYVNLSDTPPSLAPQLSELDKFLNPYETCNFRIVHTEEEIWQCNWKCLVENFMEGYHLSIVHPSTLRGYTPSQLCTKGPSGSGFTSYYANYPDNIPPRGHGAEGLTQQQRHLSFLFNVFPTQVTSQAANLLASLSLQPVNVDQVRVRWTLSVYKDDLDDEVIKGRITLWTEVNREDREKLEKMQAALRSSKAFAGPLAGEDLEGTIRDFHKFLAREFRRTVDLKADPPGQVSI
jgi:phenylpropionate dioxygenase-like ring-hydroxylating dioxygenase large terminal subunit